jgi:hypothetical protein
MRAERPVSCGFYFGSIWQEKIRAVTERFLLDLNVLVPTYVNNPTLALIAPRDADLPAPPYGD